MDRLAKLTRISLMVVSVGLAHLTVAGCADAPLDTAGPSEVNLSSLLPAGAQPVGVAVSPEGKRYVLDRLSGLYELGEGTAKLVWKTSELTSRYGQPADLDLTDVVSLGSERFAITAEDDGFLLDLHGGTFTSYFCYLPASPTDPVIQPSSISQVLQQQGIAVKQRTESVAISSDGQMLFAQPQTFRMDTGEAVGSEVFVFGAGGGEPTQVRTMPDALFLARGMVALPGQRLWLGRANELLELFPGGPGFVKHLSASVDIAGLALEPTGDLLVLDRAGNRLLRTTASAF